jgi:hypothetical protein
MADVEKSRSTLQKHCKITDGKQSVINVGSGPVAEIHASELRGCFKCGPAVLNRTP